MGRQFLNVQLVAIMRLSEVQMLDKLQLNIPAQNARLRVLTKMTSVIVTFKIMPESVDTNLDEIEIQALGKVSSFAGEGDTKVVKEPVAFGLNSLNITFVMDEDKGSPEELEKEIRDLEGVQSCETVDVRRAIG